MEKTIYLTLQETIKKILAMIFFIILARYLTVEDFGKYQQIILIISIFGIIFSMGIPISLSYFHGQVNSYRNKVFIYKRFFTTQLTLAIVGGITYLIFNKYIESIFNNDFFSKISYLISVIILINIILELFRNLSTITNKLKQYLLITSSVQVVSIITNIIVIIMTKNIFYIFVITAVFNCILLLFLIRENLKYFLVKSKSYFISKLESKYTIVMGSVALVGILNSFIDQIMVSIMLTTEAYSNLRIGAFQIPFIAIITGSLLTVMIPMISRYYREKNYTEVIKIWTLSIEKASILLVPIVIFCLIFANEIIINFFGEKYTASVMIFQIYMVQWLKAVVIFGGIMGAIGLEKELFKNTIIIAILNIIFNYFLILKLGAIGAAITTTILNYFGAFLLIKEINKKLQKNFFSYFPSNVYFKSIIISVGTGFGIYYLFLDYLNSIPAILIFAIIFYFLVIIIQMKLFYNEISYKKLRELI